MWKIAGLLTCLLGVTMVDAEEKKKCDLMNCPCSMSASQRKFCESDELFAKLNDPDTKCAFCWRGIAQFHCAGAKDKYKTELLDRAFAEAKKVNKMVLYFGNTGG